MFKEWSTASDKNLKAQDIYSAWEALQMTVSLCTAPPFCLEIYAAHLCISSECAVFGIQSKRLLFLA